MKKTMKIKNKKNILTHPFSIRAIYALTWGIASTYRFSAINQSPWLKHLNSGGRVLVCSWHQQFYPAMQYFRRFRAYRPAIMVSRSEDGEIGAGLANLNGWQTIRGSSSKGGVTALARMVKNLKDHPLAGHILDGPRGPAGKVKPGVIQMARMTGAALVPMGVSADKAWYADSWDRFMIPKPFAHVTIRFCNPIHLDPKAVKEDFEGQLRKLEAIMLRMGWHAPSIPSRLSCPARV